MTCNKKAPEIALRGFFHYACPLMTAERETLELYSPSFAFKISLTAAGLALPPVAFMT